MSENEASYEFVWPGMDKHLKVFVRPTETAGLYSFEVIVGKRVALVGSMYREALIEFLPKLKTFDNRPKASSHEKDREA